MKFFAKDQIGKMVECSYEVCGLEVRIQLESL